MMFSLNETFASKPDNESDRAWESILPSPFKSFTIKDTSDDEIDGLGFIQHPLLGPEITSLAFVHQLHCVDTLRRSFYAAVDHAVDTHTTHHAQHCLEYLRQAIICNGDANLEYREADPATGVLSTPGYSLHHCRDFAKLYHFAERWRVWNGKNRSEQTKVEEGDDVAVRAKIYYDYVSSRGDAAPIQSNRVARAWLGLTSMTGQ